ncbi:sensor domain-containing protein [Pseudomarimonas arenosa]|uniref:Sensor domain-containing protein n=1 Tax=Pseudomarimonas arenosa TaxID=2774145 RepID=A0AAW3ZLC8_9GAMM|nr:sensor domain-containing protein [Pseudomarimonas arenosa]MBD8525872.1 sensor domain-containing protein [Pseudomarimonas arenosa]
MTSPDPTGSSLPRSVAEYLVQLRQALAGADPALIQDALYDAEEYLRAELALETTKGGARRSEAEVLAALASSYGAPAEVAEIYRDTELKVQTALRAPAPPPQRSGWARVFGVIVEARTYGALLYMLLALATGVFYFSWVTVGISLSLGLSILIIGLPFVVLFFGSVRVLSLVEGRLVEALLGERMPRRPVYSDQQQPLLTRIGQMFSDPRSWASMLYFVLMLPLGILYSVLTITLLSLSSGFIASPIVALFGAQRVQFSMGDGWMFGHPVGVTYADQVWWALPLLFVLGWTLLFLTLHLARGLGFLHAALAKQLLVKPGE